MITSQDDLIVAVRKQFVERVTKRLSDQDNRTGTYSTLIRYGHPALRDWIRNEAVLLFTRAGYDAKVYKSDDGEAFEVKLRGYI